MALNEWPQAQTNVRPVDKSRFLYFWDSILGMFGI